MARVVVLLFAFGLFALPSGVSGLRLGTAAKAEGANPIRKVVTLMQDMQKEVEAEGEKEKELYDKFMCYCSSSGGELKKAVEDSKALVQELSARLEALKNEKAQIEQELTGHKTDREGAQKDLAEATAIREKEASAFTAKSGDLKGNLGAVGKAIEALESATGGAASLIQLPEVSYLGRILRRLPFSTPSDKQDFMAFMQQSGDYVPASGQIVGMLKSMKDDMESNLAEAEKDEEAASKNFDALSQAKTQEIKFASEAIEAKTVRGGELAVEVVQTQDELDDSESEVTETEAFVNSLQENCATKTKEWDERCKARTEEIKAIGEAISILTDDEALETFKKTMPSASAFFDEGSTPTFLQIAAARGRAKGLSAVVAEARRIAKRNPGSPLALLEMKLRTRVRRAGMRSEEGGTVETVVEGMIGVLSKEADADSKQKAWCDEELEKGAAEEKAIKDKEAATQAVIDELTDQQHSLEEEMAATTADLQAIDKMATEMTEERKSTHADFFEFMTQSQAAIHLLGKAKNRMNKFYNPTAYVKEEEEDKDSFAQMHHRHRHRHHRVAPPPPPAADFSSGPNSKSTGILALLDSIIHDMEKDVLEAQMNEKQAQQEYVEEMNSASENRKACEQKVTKISNDKAKIVEKTQEAKDGLRTVGTELQETAITLANIHGQCDALEKTFDERSAKRNDDIKGLKDALAVLRS